MQLIILASAFAAAAAATTKVTELKCVPPSSAPEKIETMLTQCQYEIKQALLQEALEVLGEPKEKIRREKRATFSNEERRVAGCLLQCIYRKMGALDGSNLPKATGLVELFTEGVTDKNYYLATIQGVQQCMAKEIKQINANGTFTEGYTCDVAYDLFMCVSKQIEEICGILP
uniref:Putative odorant-binding protein 5 n=1 Tax=Euschistus heros TaxID=437493 RepID=A0A097QHA8_EUSHE|nr:putative odorant-binding protein 5 [Euschistus heros]